MRCGRQPSPATAIFSDDAGRVMHGRITQSAGPHGRHVCGGLVLSGDDDWTAQLAPGRLWVCLSAGVSLTAHVVRLGRLAHTRSGSWTGTALCAKRMKSSGRWLPMVPEAAARGPTCRACAQALATEEE